MLWISVGVFAMMLLAMGKHLTSDQRGRIAEKIMEWGNLVFAGLVIAQLVPGTSPFRVSIVFVGLMSIVSAYVFGFLIMRGGD